MRLYEEAINLGAKLSGNENGCLGEAYHRIGNLDRAIRNYKLAVEKAPKKSEWWSNLGVALQTEGDDLKGAETAYKKAIKLVPDYEEAYSNLGALQTQMEKPT